MLNRHLIPRKKTIDKTIEHCCSAMKESVESAYSPVMYRIHVRTYYILDKSGNGAIDIRHCFECGTILPTSLSKIWYTILEKEYGLEYPTKDYKTKAPKEFHTDEWWKKRGL